MVDETPTESGNYQSLEPAELAEQIEAGTAPRIIDVREQFEWQIVHLDEAEHKPLSEVQNWWRELDPQEALVIYCHHGQRSAALCRTLAAEDFSELYNLAGGIEAWAEEVDPSLPRY